jgi:glycerophosphoryl diester phosphodiesterase
VAHRTPTRRAACEQLAAAGAGVFEADVQVDSHDRLVVSHYLPLRRIDRVQRDNWRLRWHSAAARDTQLLDLERLVPPGCRVLLDLKEKAPDRRARLVAAVRASLPNRTRFVICSPRPDDLEPLRRAGFVTWRTVGYEHELAAVLAAGRLPDAAVTIRHSLLTGDRLERLRQVVPEVVTWTVNDPHRARALRDLGVDGVTTDRAAVLRALTTRPA